jgi:glutaredoxin-like protein
MADGDGLHDPPAAGSGGKAGLVRFYWRPGCPFCYVLRRGLRRVGLRLDEVDIWADPEAAAAVRGITGGDETVPTVVVAGHAMVNPSTRQVLAAVHRYAPQLVPAPDAGPRPWWRRLLAHPR